MFPFSVPLMTFFTFGTTTQIGVSTNQIKTQKPFLAVVRSSKRNQSEDVLCFQSPVGNPLLKATCRSRIRRRSTVNMRRGNRKSLTKSLRPKTFTVMRLTTAMKPPPKQLKLPLDHHQKQTPTEVGKTSKKGRPHKFILTLFYVI